MLLGNPSSVTPLRIAAFGKPMEWARIYHALLYFGGGMSNGTQHDRYPLPLSWAAPMGASKAIATLPFSTAAYAALHGLLLLRRS